MTDAFDLPPAPDGYKWRVTHRGFDRELGHVKPLNVYLARDGGYGIVSDFRSWLDPMAVAWNNPASVRRAAAKVLARHNRRERRSLRRAARAEARPQSTVMRTQARDQRRVEKRTARVARINARYGDLIGTYPPKRLGGSR